MPFDDWMTNPSVINMADKMLGGIDFDPASNWVAQQYVRANTFCVTPTEYAAMRPNWHGNVKRDGLWETWSGNVWLNPPYSAGNIDRFTDKALIEWKLNHPTQMIVLVNSATDAKWYHKLLKASSCTLFWKGRIKFWKIFDGKAHEKWEGQKSKEKGIGKIGNSPRYLNTLFYFGDNVDRFHHIFDGKGTFMERSK